MLYSFWVAVDDRTQTVDLSRYNGLKTELITDKRWNAESKLVSPSVDDFVWDDESDYVILYENTNMCYYKLETSSDEDNYAIYLFQKFYNLIEVSEIKLDKATATLKKGATATLKATITPTDATNQELTWTSSDEKVATVDADGKVTAVAAGTATITCTATDGSGVSAACEVTVTEAESPEKSWVFTDVAVNEGNWKYEAVKYVYENGYMTGTSDTTFDPDKPLTRGMVVTVLYRMAGSPDITYTGTYSDVKAGKYYAKAVAWAAKNGIATGYSNGTFGPEKNISRQELAKMICQFAKLQGHETTETTDISGYVDYSMVSGYASKYMQWAVATNLISGKKKSGTYYLDPKGEATRAECAAILQRYEQYYEK
jgi:hypothetical protein